MKKNYKFLIFLMLLLSWIIPMQKVHAQDTQPKKTGVNIFITQSPKIIVKVTAVTDNLCYGESKGAVNIEPSGGYPPYKYHWSHGDTTQDIAGLKAGKYRV